MKNNKNPRTGTISPFSRRVILPKKKPVQFVKEQPIEDISLVEDKVLLITKLIGEKLIQEIRIYLESLPQRTVVVSQHEAVSTQPQQFRPSISIDQSIIDVGIDEKVINKGAGSIDLSTKQDVVEDVSLQEKKTKLSSLKKNSNKK